MRGACPKTVGRGQHQRSGWCFVRDAVFRLEELVAGVRSLRLVTGRNVIRRAFDLSIRTVSPRVRHHDTVVARDDRRELPRSSANAAPRVASIRSRQQQQQRRVKQQREQVRYETSLRPTALSPESSAQNGSRRIHPCLAGNGQSHSARTLCLVTNRVNSSRQGQRTSALFRGGWDWPALRRVGPPDFLDDSQWWADARRELAPPSYLETGDGCAATPETPANGRFGSGVPSGDRGPRSGTGTSSRRGSL